MYFYERARRLMLMTHLLNLETLQFVVKVEENYTGVLYHTLNYLI